jgi:membrane protein
MKTKAKKWWLIFKTAGQNFFSGRPFIYSSSIAYFAIFSLPAMAIIAVMVAGSFYEDESVRKEMLEQVSQFAGPDSAAEVARIMDKMSQRPEGNLTKIISIATLLFSATTVLATLQESINAIWHIKAKPKKEVVKFLINRLLSLSIVFSLGILLLLSLIADTVLTVFRDLINQYLSAFAYQLIWIINTFVSGGIITVIFALIYMILPDAKIKWKHVWIGALITAILFLLGKYLIAIYLRNTNFTESYGAAGSLVALLAWVYYSVLILLFGAEFTYAYTKHVGGRIMPSNHAVSIKVEEIEREIPS